MVNTVKKPKAEDGLGARRAEVRMKRKEEAQERRRIANMKREQAVKNAEARRKVREKNGGAGMTIVFYETKPPRELRGRITDVFRRKRR